MLGSEMLDVAIGHALYVSPSEPLPLGYQRTDVHSPRGLTPYFFATQIFNPKCGTDDRTYLLPSYSTLITRVAASIVF